MGELLLWLNKYIYLSIVIFASNQSFSAKIIAKQIVAKELRVNLLRIAKSFAQISVIAAIASFALDLVDIYIKCGFVTSLFIVPLLATLLFGMTVIMAFAGPFSIIMLNFLLTMGASFVKNHYYDYYSCNE
jgi:hypothetical protein